MGRIMAQYREALPQLSGELFLADGGLETDLMFNHSIDIREFAAHTLLPDPAGREALASYFRGFLSLARDLDTGFILDSQTWKAHPHWASDLGASQEQPLLPLAVLGRYMREEAVFAAYQDLFIIGGVLSVLTLILAFMLPGRRRLVPSR